ncbi:hypothetical protein WJX73_005205 [Symbiochloris irregularis]|uniref:Zinc-finger domain-containing protein n=1 Tax=Symbiochloris irregularis TaxID=706552 RepID=A0AAW1PVN6_9CHLO
MNSYEREREARIKHNQQRMQELGLPQLRAALEKELKSTPVRKARASRLQHEGPVRRSGRSAGAQNYNEEVLAGLKEADSVPRRPLALAKAESSADSASTPSRVVRVQGGRVYDSEWGITCHWCRQKTLDESVTCTKPECGLGKLPVTFCQMCLRNRHGEDVEQARASGVWVCPSCRGSCGEGCIGSCCNCGPCRKKAGLTPTHQMIKQAREAGFTNVHDFLVHRHTGESQKELHARKAHLPWCSSAPAEQAPDADAQQQAPATSTIVADAAVSITLAVSVGSNKSPAPTIDASASKQEAQPAGTKQDVDLTTLLGPAKKGVQVQGMQAAGKSKGSIPEAAVDDAQSADCKPMTRKQRILQSIGLKTPGAAAVA